MPPVRAQKSTVNKSKPLPLGARSISEGSSSGSLAVLQEEDKKREMTQVQNSAPSTIAAALSWNLNTDDSAPQPSSDNTTALRTPSSSSTNRHADKDSQASESERRLDNLSTQYLFNEGSLRKGRPPDRGQSDSVKGTAAVPINIEDSDSEDDNDHGEGSSTPARNSFAIEDIRSPRTPIGRPPPTRPNLSAYKPPSREYDWITSDSRSTTSSLDHASRGSSDSARKRRKREKLWMSSNLRGTSDQLKQRRVHIERQVLKALEMEDSGQAERARRVLKLLEPLISPSRVEELRFKAGASSGIPGWPHMCRD